MKQKQIIVHRSNPYDLTDFDIEFNFIPQIDNKKVNFELAVYFLELNYSKKYENQRSTSYLIPIIGKFIKYDEQNQKYIFYGENEFGIEYNKISNSFVEYIIHN